MPARGLPDAPRRAGMYESFYLRAVSPEEPVGVWIRYTVHKRPGAAPARLAVVHGLRRAPRTPVHAQAHHRRAARARRRLDRGRRQRDGPRARARARAGRRAGRCASTQHEPELRHLPRGVALPGAAAAHQAHEPRARGALRRHARAAGRPARSSCDGWPGWSATTGAPSTPSAGSGCTGSASQRSPRHGSTWRSAGCGSAGRLTPWVANGALSLDGARLRIGGLGARGLRVAESASACTLSLPGADGLMVEARVDDARGGGRRLALRRSRTGRRARRGQLLGRRLTLTVRRPGGGRARSTPRTARPTSWDARARPRRADRALRRRLTRQKKTGPARGAGPVVWRV